MSNLIKVYLNTLRDSGLLAYEYNPLYNYQTDEDLYLINKKYLVPKGYAVNIYNGELLIKKNNVWVDKRNLVISSGVVEATEGTLYARKGSILDMDTEKLNFDLEHPVEIEVLPSYDGSVNLILNDDKNPPRIINSRFSARKKNTYEIVNRIGENDTNVYNSSSFDKDSSLYFLYGTNPKIEYKDFIKGNLPVGQYCFYFTYCDADENESDYIAETGLIPVFIGTDCDPKSIDGGIKNLTSDKGIRLRIKNLDKQFDYLKIYYVRYFADYAQNRVYECKKILRKYPINLYSMYLNITGYEDSEDLDPNILNISRFNPKSVLTQAQCKNMLFFGNIVKNSDDYTELSDCALRIIPEVYREKLSDVNTDYKDVEKKEFGYYDSKNMYNKVGYFNEEYYRFGVVFIYENGTLSNVYNTTGKVLNESSEEEDILNIYNSASDEPILKREYIKSNEEGFILNTEYNKIFGQLVNSKGVCKILVDNLKPDEIIGIKFNYNKDVIKLLKEDLGIRGFFVVRQKCIPNIIAQCFILPVDPVLEAPVIRCDNEGNLDICESFLNITDGDDSRILTNSYYSRLLKESPPKQQYTYAAICPDFLLNLPYYNQIFNGSKFRLLEIYSNTLNREERFYKASYNGNSSNIYSDIVMCTVTEDVETVALENQVYRLELGKTEEAYRFEFFREKDEENEEATNIVRGKYSPYIAVYSEQSNLNPNSLYNIYRNLELQESLEFKNRMDSSEPFYAISERYNFGELPEDGLICWRGDCYLNTFTYRLNRNFNDPSLPNNDKIIDKNTWKDNYLIDEPEKWADISTSDVNAVQLGSWITFKVRSAMNYALRSVDHSYVAEEALMGAPRSFYPRSLLLWRGENKLPDSYLYNDAYRASLGYKCYFALPDVNYIKDTFSNRILYSAIAILDSFKNNYRYSLSTYFRDYSQEYGSIQKLVGFEGYLLVVFEHAIGIAVVNERVLAGGGDGEPVFINTLNVLPEELTIITDTYGTQWGDSVVKSEAGYVYGIDTVAKKIWRVKGQQIEILSDFKVNKFLVNNITLSERETTPTIGLRNVKTHYNNNKKDIIFTFYDDKYKDEENTWSLCYNELLGAFVTFYSWIPSFSENIDTKFFTFNRNTAKALALLLKCNSAIPENTGVLLQSPVLEKEEEDVYKYPKLYYVYAENAVYYTVINDTDNTTSIKEYIGDDNVVDGIKFRLEPDHWHNYEKFKIDDNNIIQPKEGVDFDSLINEQKVILLYITPYLEYIKDTQSETLEFITFKTEVIAFTTSSILENPLLTLEEKSRAGLTTDFYLHGKAGIFNVAENLYPTYWYGEYHPFEFEFVVNDKVGLQKIFTDLIMISNKAEPESFHFEIEGDNYEFSSDKRNMYFRQEATKNLYLNLGSDIIYNRYYTDVAADKYTYELYYRGNPTRRNERNDVSFEEYTQLYANLDRVYPIDSLGLTLQVKSTIFPLYYEKVDTFNNIYHDYIMMHDDDGVYDFLNLSGSEISWNRDLNQFNIITHIKNRPIDLVGRLRGNSRYKEGKWHIQIPTISFILKNEDDWPTLKDMPQALKDEGPLANRDSSIKVPPIVINSQNVPNNVDFDSISNIMSNSTGCEGGYVEGSSWSNRKETRIRDKWMKIRVRYSGKNLAIIHSLTTLYNLSYS